MNEGVENRSNWSGGLGTQRAGGGTSFLASCVDDVTEAGVQPTEVGSDGLFRLVFDLALHATREEGQ